MPSSFSAIGWPMTQTPLGSATFGHAQPLAEAIPGYSAGGANTANDDTDQVTAACILPQDVVDTPSLGQESSSTNPSKECACMVCLGIGIFESNSRGPTPHLCHFAGCRWYPIPGDHRAKHAKTHYRRGPKNSQTPFYCLVENCRFSSKRWSDLRRHTTAKHCNSPNTFACSVIGCKYHGEGNGFTRKDKLTAHYKNMHQGQKIPGQAARAIKPAPASSHAEASGSSSIGA